MFLTETNEEQIHIIAQLCTRFYHLMKALQIRHQDPYTPVIKAKEAILNKENIETSSFVMYNSFFLVTDLGDRFIE
jgi:hypothetical protein